MISNIGFTEHHHVADAVGVRHAQFGQDLGGDEGQDHFGQAAPHRAEAHAGRQQFEVGEGDMAVHIG